MATRQLTTYIVDKFSINTTMCATLAALTLLYSGRRNGQTCFGLSDWNKFKTCYSDMKLPIAVSVFVYFPPSLPRFHVLNSRQIFTKFAMSVMAFEIPQNTLTQCSTVW